MRRDHELAVRRDDAARNGAFSFLWPSIAGKSTVAICTYCWAIAASTTLASEISR